MFALTLMICVSNTTFFSTSKELPDPNKPVCPGLSTRISDAIQRDVPLISWTKEVFSRFQTLTTAGMTYADWRSVNSLRFMHGMFKESKSLRTLALSSPEDKIPDVIIKWNSGNRLCNGPVDQTNAWLISPEHVMDILQKVPTILSRHTAQSESHLKQRSKHFTSDSSKTINFSWSWGNLLYDNRIFSCSSCVSFAFKITSSSLSSLLISNSGSKFGSSTWSFSGSLSESSR